MIYLSINPSSVRQFRDTPYYVSSNGEVYHKYKKGYAVINGCKEIEKGYYRVRIHIGNKKYNLNRMVYECYKGEIPEGYNVIHRNGCIKANELINLKLQKQNAPNKLLKHRKNTKKIINLKTREIYLGTRDAVEHLGHTRKAIKNVCSNKPTKLNLDVAWWDDVNGKAFRGDYDKYYKKHMEYILRHEFRH